MQKGIFNQWNEYRKLIGLGANQAILIILLSLISTISEAFGIAIFLPIFQFAEAGGNYESLISESALWEYFFNASASIDLTITLPILLFISFLFFFSRQLFLYIRSVYMANVQRTLKANLMNQLFNRYLRANSTFHDRYPIGSFANLVGQESESAVGGTLIPLDMITSIIMLSVYISMLIFVNFELTIVAIFVFILVGYSSKIWVNRSKKAGIKVVEANTELTSFLIDRLKSPRLVRLSHAEDIESKNFSRLTFNQKFHMLHSAILRFRTQSILEPFFVATSLIFIYFSVSVFKMSFEVIGIYLLVSFRLMPVINALILLIQKKKNRVGSMEIVKSRINEMISEKELDIGKSDLNLALSSIRFNSVSYKYPSRNDNALSRVSFSLPINHMTAIVGPSGGGKSTLIDLLPRLRTPTEGFIEINGNNIEKYRLTDLRKLISYATQNQQIFDGTIKEHILYGKYNATDKEVRGAVKLSGAEEFIEQLPQGLDTNIGGDTIKLSGGQIQRLDLARVLIRKSPILILDEPTSNLDLESESEFKKVLGEIRKKKDTTIIAVSHKLSNIVDADQIIVINKGKIDDIGSHSQLLSREGWYSRAWNLKN